MIAYYPYSDHLAFVILIILLILALIPAWPYNKAWGYPPLGTLVLIILLLLLLGCSQGKYVGPSVGANVGYNGVSVGVALYGPNPSASNVAVVTGLPSPTAAPTPLTVSAK